MTPESVCRSVAPIMPTRDIARTVKTYEALGFVVDVLGDFVMTRRDAVEIFLSLNPDHDPLKTASCIYVRVDDADALHAHWTRAAVGDLRVPHDTDYGAREFAWIDPDGNMLLCASQTAIGSAQ